MVAHELTGPDHRLWTTTHPPALTVSDGDTITFSVQEALAGQFDALRTGDPLPDLDWDRVYPLAGPIIVDGAEPGDVLEIEVLEVSPTDWGWTAVVPGLGLLSDDFPDAHFHRWDLSGGPAAGADFKGLATVPVRPFLGVMGVCPDTVEPLPVLPPGHFGGNLDCRDLVAGARLYLPVQVPGARLALGDPHAATARCASVPSRRRPAGPSGSGCTATAGSPGRSCRPRGRCAGASTTPATTPPWVSART
jgi:acetamidase/formamidase